LPIGQDITITDALRSPRTLAPRSQSVAQQAESRLPEAQKNTDRGRGEWRAAMRWQRLTSLVIALQALGAPAKAKEAPLYLRWKTPQKRRVIDTGLVMAVPTTTPDAPAARAAAASPGVQMRPSAMTGMSTAATISATTRRLMESEAVWRVSLV